MKYLASILMLSLLSMGVSHAKDDRWFRSHARVIELEPVIKQDYAALRKVNCRQPALGIANSMAQDIRQQEDKTTRRLTCKARTQPGHRVVGYWVTYDYNGHKGRKYMSEKPGSWIPVTVSLEPLHAARSR